MRFFLNLFELIASGFIIFAVVQLFLSIIDSYKNKEAFSSVLERRLFKYFKTPKILLVFGVIIIGGYHFIQHTWFPVLQVGAFYEPSNYVQKYEATLQYENFSMPCIAHIECTTDIIDEGYENTRLREYRRYYLYKLEVPGGKTHEIDYIECSWNSKNERFSTKVDLGDFDPLYLDYSVVVDIEHIADTQSKEKLDFYSFESGYYVSSKNSNVLHNERCRYVRQIEKQNILRFGSIAEAIASGHGHACSVCYENW